MCGDQGPYAPDLRLLVRSLWPRPPFSFPFSWWGSDLLGWGKGYSVTREDCSTYGHHYPRHQSLLTFPGPRLSPLRLPRTPKSSIPRSLLSRHLPLCPLPTHLPLKACSPCTSGEETTSITVTTSPTGAYAPLASTSFPSFQTGSSHPHPAQIVMTIITATIYHQNSEHVTVHTAFQSLNKSFRVCARCAHPSYGRQSSRAYTY